MKPKPRSDTTFLIVPSAIKKNSPSRTSARTHGPVREEESQDHGERALLRTLLRVYQTTGRVVRVQRRRFRGRRRGGTTRSPPRSPRPSAGRGAARGAGPP